MKVAIIIGLLLLLFFTLFLQTSLYENFDRTVPTPIPLPIRSDQSCSDPRESAIYDRYNNAGSELIKSGLSIPPTSRNNRLTGGPESQFGGLGEYVDKCNSDLTDVTKKGTKVFVDTGKVSLKADGSPWLDATGKPFNLVDLYCCRGQSYQIPGTTEISCLPPCPSKYHLDPKDNTICLRDDNMCAYTPDLSANIARSWINTCATLHKQNLDITKTLQSISSVVSTFTFQTSNVNNDYGRLSTRLSYYDTHGSDASKRANYNNNFVNVRNKYNDVTALQGNIIQKFEQLKGEKTRFDTLYNQFGCSNYL